MRAFVATDCEGMARADLFVRADGEVLVNELNTIPGFTVDERLRAAVRGVGDPVRRAAAAARRPRGRALRTPPPPALLMNHWRLLVMRHPALSAADEAAFDELLARTPEAGTIDYDLRAAEVVVPAPPDRGAASCCTARTSRRSTSSATRQNFDAHQRADRRGVRLRRRDLAALLRGRQPPVAQSYINWCEHVRRTARRATCSRSAPTRATSARGRRDDLPPAERRRSARRRRAASSSASVPVRPRARLTGDARRLPAARTGRAATGAANRCAQVVDRGNALRLPVTSLMLRRCRSRRRAA